MNDEDQTENRKSDTPLDLLLEKKLQEIKDAPVSMEYPSSRGLGAIPKEQRKTENKPSMESIVGRVVDSVLDERNDFSDREREEIKVSVISILDGMRGSILPEHFIKDVCFAAPIMAGQAVLMRLQKRILLAIAGARNG